ncbi:hypothetical protein GCM10010495_28750 [Kitasatospora herbaricolor]|nr:hypothetical protein GCM10010495_28750 [Kitasatospora herbaricolor]
MGRLAEWAIDTSHFTPTGTTCAKEVLKEASRGIAGVARHLGRRQCGGNAGPHRAPAPALRDCQATTDTYYGRDRTGGRHP